MSIPMLRFIMITVLSVLMIINYLRLIYYCVIEPGEFDKRGKLLIFLVMLAIFTLVYAVYYTFTLIGDN